MVSQHLSQPYHRHYDTPYGLCLCMCVMLTISSVICDIMLYSIYVKWKMFIWHDALKCIWSAYSLFPLQNSKYCDTNGILHCVITTPQQLCPNGYTSIFIDCKPFLIIKCLTLNNTFHLAISIPSHLILRGHLRPPAIIWPKNPCAHTNRANVRLLSLS